MTERCALHLVGDWDAAWRILVRPWLQAPPELRRDFVLVPTRAHAHALKLRCVRENVPLLGVEFLTPGLAREKWRGLARPAQSALGRELLLLNLRAELAARLAALAEDDPDLGWWRSLRSDPDGALTVLDELLAAGLTAADCPVPPLRQLLLALEKRVAAAGFALAQAQERAGALDPLPADALRLPPSSRLLIYGFTAEHGAEFLALAALARRGDEVTVILPEPTFADKDTDERWIRQWEQLSGAEAQPEEDAGPNQAAGAPVAALWTGGDGEGTAARIIVGRTPEEEMVRVADEIGRLLAEGADNVAVVFPQADAAHLRLVRLLGERGLPYNDLIGLSGPPAPEVPLQRALLDFYARGARLDELLELWPRLHALSLTTVTPGEARDAAERVFGETQAHALSVNRERITARTRPAGRELARLTDLLLPAWPENLTLAEALSRFATLCERLHLALPEGWPVLAAYAARDANVLPQRLVLDTLQAFLPERSPTPEAPGRGLFAPVTLTTRRRAGALTWSHLILVEANAGVWPQRHEPGAWLSDEARQALTARAPLALGVPTGEERARLEKTGYADLARQTTGTVVFSASVAGAAEPELPLAPNAWLERVLVATDPVVAEAGLEEAFRRRAGGGLPADAGAEPGGWAEVWRARRRPAVPFDDWFFCADPAVVRPDHLAARLLERGVKDPAVLWYEGVLAQAPAARGPLVRARKKSLGTLVHRLLASALRGPAAQGPFTVRPPAEQARRQLAEAWTELRAQWPQDRYWESFAAELGSLAERLLARLEGLSSAGFVATEFRLPTGCRLHLGGTAGELGLTGRIDLVLLDRPEWRGAEVDVVDFKTGADRPLAAAKMARGDSLQLGLYLEAVRLLGAASARVWMVKPDAVPSALTLAELPEALTRPLARLGRHLTEGRYGALTPDRTEFTTGGDWPLACVPIPHEVLEQKFAATFGPEADAAEEADDE